MFVDHNCEFSDRYTIKENGSYVTLKRFYGKVYTKGTPINFKNMNDMENKLSNAQYQLTNKVPDELGVVTANIGKMARAFKSSNGFPTNIYSDYTFLELNDLTISNGKTSGDNIIV